VNEKEMVRCRMLQNVAVYCSGAVWCSVIQCVAVCCSVFVPDPGEVMLDISFYIDIGVSIDIGVYIDVCVQIGTKKTLVQCV